MNHENIRMQKQRAHNDQIVQHVSSSQAPIMAMVYFTYSDKSIVSYMVMAPTYISKNFGWHEITDVGHHGTPAYKMNMTAPNTAANEVGRNYGDPVSYQVCFSRNTEFSSIIVRVCNIHRTYSEIPCYDDVTDQRGYPGCKPIEQKGGFYSISGCFKDKQHSIFISSTHISPDNKNQVSESNIMRVMQMSQMYGQSNPIKKHFNDEMEMIANQTTTKHFIYVADNGVAYGCY